MTKWIRFGWVVAVLAPVTTFGEVDSYRLSWRDDPATSMVIGWNQVSGSDPVVCYDTEGRGKHVDQYNHTQDPDRVVPYRGMTNHFVRLENLTPDTAYYFRVKDSEGVGQQLWFRTAPDRPQPFTFIAGGDSRSNPEPRRKGNTLVAKLRPLFVLFGGDYTGSGKPLEWEQWFNDWQLTISEDGRIYPVIPTHGNHENADLQMMDKLFDTPHTNQYYSMGFAGELMRIWVLNTELYKDPTSVPEQQAWIEADLPQYPGSQWKVAAYHRPMRPHTQRKAEGQDRIAAWAQLFYESGVDLVIESDTHMVKQTYPLRPSSEPGSYESFIRDDSSGTVYIGEGSWGAPMRPANDDKPWTMASDSFHQFKWIQVFQDEMLIRTVKFEQAEDVVPLTEKNLFEKPENMIFWKPETGPFLRLPFHAEHPSFSEPVKPTLRIQMGERWAWSLDGNGWAEGLAPLGYGDKEIKTIINAGEANVVLSAIFRKKLMIDHPEEISRLFFDVLVDDGCVVSLNGNEVIRHNMPKGEISRETLASKRAPEGRVMAFPVDAALLNQGANLIEVRVHQCAPNSSDLTFDMGVRTKEKK